MHLVLRGVARQLLARMLPNHENASRRKLTHHTGMRQCSAAEASRAEVLVWLEAAPRSTEPGDNAEDDDPAVRPQHENKMGGIDLCHRLVGSSLTELKIGEEWMEMTPH
jgi:hypothetical protein